MREYRDDLASAHERIERLEADLVAARRNGVPVPVAVPYDVSFPVGGLLIGAVCTLFAGCALSATTIAGMERLSRRFDRAPTTAPIEAPSPPPDIKPAIRRTYGSWYSPSTPTVVDVDGDGQEDIVGLVWQTDAPAAALSAVAIDGKTLTPRWVAGPWPSQWASDRTHHLVVDGRLVVSDSQEKAHVLSLATGESLRELTVPGGATLLSPLGGTDVHFGGTTAIDIATGEHTKVPQDAHRVRSSPCGKAKDWEKHPYDAIGFSIADTLDDGDQCVSVGWHGADPIAAGWTRGAKKPAWKQSLVTDERRHGGSPKYVLTGGMLFALEQTFDGPFRVIARDAKTGELRWRTRLPQTFVGSYLASFVAKGSLAVVVADHKLHILDAKTGEIRAVRDHRDL